MTFRKSIALLALLCGVARAQTARPITEYLTTADRNSILEKQAVKGDWTKEAADGPQVIRVDESAPMQSMQGFGFALTGGSAQLLHRMSAPARHKLLQEIFSHNGNGIGVSFVRLTIGSSDLNDHVYTYDDVPDGKQDRALEKFSLQEDEADVIPVMQEILAIAPDLRVMASPWTAPSWMKTNGAPKGGSLRREDYTVYANYFVHYLQGMAAAGIKVDAITVQNEPQNANNTPSMVLSAAEEGAFIRDALGPALRSAKLATEILLWDHNCDLPEYPLSILQDAKAAQYVTGTAFHLYAGNVSAMSRVHDAHPDKDIDFTEQMVIEDRGSNVRPIASPFEHVVIGAIRNWSRTVLLWNLASDPALGPHTPNGGCPMCQGAVTLDGDHVHRNIAYYTIAEIAKLIPPGTVHVASNSVNGLGNVAFRLQSGGMVLFVTNNSKTPQSFTLEWQAQTSQASLPPGAIAAFVW